MNTANPEPSPPSSAATLARRLGAEFIGTALLVTVVVGSGIAASRLSTDVGLQLLENSIATALGLGVLILLLAPVSGAHFNPAVSLVDAVLGAREHRLTPPHLVAYIAAQITGGIAGALLANAMFGVATTIATADRASWETVLAEVVATAGLILLIAGLVRTGRGIPIIAIAVGSYIGAAYWFTSSTSFANPAVTIGRIFTDTFAGIAPTSVLPFLLAQLIGAAIGAIIAALLFPRPSTSITTEA